MDETDKFNANHNVRGAFVSWTPYSGRSQSFIDALGLKPIYVHYLKLRKPVYALFKYIPQFVTTLVALYRQQPQVVFVMDPPVFAVMAIYLFCAWSGTRYIIDCHSGVFESLKWRWSLPIQKFLSRRASAVLVTNPCHYQIVASWQAVPIIMGDPPLKIQAFEHPYTVNQSQSPTILVINRFADDEAVEQMLEAAGRYPKVRFNVTGDTAWAKPRWLKNNPVNVTFTGWIPIEKFYSYLCRANAVMTLTTKKNTLLQGGWETMFAGQPLITSNTETLRDYFTGGTVFVENTPEGIATGIQTCLAQEMELRSQMQALRVAKNIAWRQSLDELEQVLGLRFIVPELESASVN